MKNLPLILAIDTSCDDTSASIVCGQFVLSNVVASQTQLHRQYGGVFPTVAKQAHRENIEPTVRAALRRAHLTLSDLSAIAVTQGPGLAPALEISIEYARKLVAETRLPLIPVNHIEGHVLSPLARPLGKTVHLSQAVDHFRDLQKNLTFPVLSIIVSGKNTEFVAVNAIGQYKVLGTTVDDAAGEALDKFGRMVDLGYPAGPTIEAFARLGDSRRYTFPLPMTTSGNANMSFSGLKTAARSLIEKEQALHPLSQQNVYDLCASFQYSVFRAITYKLSKILSANHFFGVWLGGGVSSNAALRAAIRTTIAPHHLKLQTPYSKKLCIDNAAMIGLAASFKLARGEWTKEPQNMERLPRWSVETSAKHLS
jgi:N6-L-threonylcarbamoyladenine synthase